MAREGYVGYNAQFVMTKEGQEVIMLWGPKIVLLHLQNEGDLADDIMRSMTDRPEQWSFWHDTWIKEAVQ